MIKIYSGAYKKALKNEVPLPAIKEIKRKLKRRGIKLQEENKADMPAGCWWYSNDARERLEFENIIYDSMRGMM